MNQTRRPSLKLVDRSKPFPKKGPRVTSYDVALYAGVSQSTVSRCLKPGASVSPKMRERVMKAVKK
ncbi:MAG: LacI family DNA-binding transcriptional regulator, partial [Gammaproteobacteria bacterium]